MNWEIEYDNEGNGGFSEWWTVTDGDRSFTCTVKEDADWLCEKLEHECNETKN